jgi:peptidoglycan L-alanyl-D-glutamate endopeptidase CwlK
VLLELGFISNTRDNALFDQNFNAYADAVTSAILGQLGISCGSGATPPSGTAPQLPPSRDAVREIQSTLNSRYNAGLAVDGIAGPLTNRALVRAYQTELNQSYNAGLTADGIFGPLTRAATRTMRQGDSGNLVWVLQAALTLRGFPVIRTGSFGPLTDAAVRNFQSFRGLVVDGLAGPNTMSALLQ